MKTFKLIFIIPFLLAFFNCSDSDKDNDNLSTLQQSSWSGNYIVDDQIQGTIGLAFYTDKDGYCDLKYNTGSLYQDNFTYWVDGKLIVIKGSAAGGNWLLSSKTKNTMTLVKGTNGDPSGVVKLVLEKDI